MPNHPSDRARAIAHLNDQFRRSAGVLCSTQLRIPGRHMMTAGIAALNADVKIEIFARVREFDSFEEANDPHGEHDFGAFTTVDGERVFWKVDYFANDSMKVGSEHPEDPQSSFRLLTIMLAAEY